MTIQRGSPGAHGMQVVGLVVTTELKSLQLSNISRMNPTHFILIIITELVPLESNGLPYIPTTKTSINNLPRSNIGNDVLLQMRDSLASEQGKQQASEGVSYACAPVMFHLKALCK